MSMPGLFDGEGVVDEDGESAGGTYGEGPGESEGVEERSGNGAGDGRAHRHRHLGKHDPHSLQQNQNKARPLKKFLI